MSFLNEWHDYVRVLAFGISFYSFVLLLIRYWGTGGRNWNIKTKDYWFALVMWSLAGCAFTLQGLILDRPFTPAFVFLTAAVLVTGKGLRRKGEWGGNAA